MSRSVDVTKLAAGLATTDDAAAILKQLAALGEAATPAAPAVIAQLGHAGEDEAFLALEAMIPEIVAQDLVATLKDPAHLELAKTAFSAIATRVHLSRTGAIAPYIDVMRDTAVPLLIDLIKRRATARSSFVHALGVIGSKDDAAFAALVKTLSDKDRHVRFHAVLGLGCFGDRAVPHIEKLFRDKDGGDDPAVRTCIKLGTELAYTALKKATKRGGYIGEMARKGVAAMAARYEPSSEWSTLKASRPTLNARDFVPSTTNKPTNKPTTKPKTKTKTKPTSKPKPKSKRRG